MKKTILAGICLVLAVACIGCNTIKGFGEDLGTVGGWVVKGSDNVQEAGK
ncbi:MAG: entericidin EcnA/B family protein [Candidatus Omnitrophica bacterium]|nr:entericidin EcnA/B family protein [Candidatus Omnitrophota bacterium]